jgi:hypothetical protein
MQGTDREDWTSEDFVEAKQEAYGTLNVLNSADVREFAVKVTMEASSIHLRASSRDSTFAVTIKTLDLPIPSSRTASLMWLKLLLGKALTPRSEVGLACTFMIMDELKVASLFLKQPLTPVKRVALEEAAALQLRMKYSINTEPYELVLQVPKLYEFPLLGEADDEQLDVLQHPSVLIEHNVSLKSILERVEKEKRDTNRLFAEAQKEIAKLRQTLK